MKTNRLKRVIKPIVSLRGSRSDDVNIVSADILIRKMRCSC